MGRHNPKLKSQKYAYSCDDQFLWFPLSNRCLVQRTWLCQSLSLILCSNIGNHTGNAGNHMMVVMLPFLVKIPGLLQNLELSKNLSSYLIS